MGEEIYEASKARPRGDTRTETGGGKVETFTAPALLPPSRVLGLRYLSTGTARPSRAAQLVDRHGVS